MTCGGRFRAALTTEDSQQQQQPLSRLVISLAKIALEMFPWPKLPQCENQDMWNNKPVVSLTEGAEYPGRRGNCALEPLQ